MIFEKGDLVMTNGLIWRKFVVLLAVFALLVAACGNDDDDGPVASEPDPPAVSDQASDGAAEEPTAPEETAGESEGTTDEGAETTGNAEQSTDPEETAVEEVSDVDPEGVLRRAVNLTEYGGLSFDPASMQAGQYQFTYPVTNSWVKYLPSGEIEMDLAESAEIVDATTIRVVLKPNLVFSDGESLTAQVAVDSIIRTTEAAAPGLRINGGLSLIESMDVVSDTEFVINLTAPVGGSWFKLLADAETTPVSPASMDGGDHARDVITAGPFKIDSYQEGSVVTLVKNDLYWDADNVRLNAIELVHTDGPTAVVNALRSGAADFATGPSLITPQELEALGDSVEGIAKQLPAAYLINGCFSEPSPVANVLVRHALNYATDRDELNELVYGGLSAPAWGMVPPGSAEYNPDLEGLYAYNPDRARELLAEAGYGDGLDLKIVTTTGDSQTISEVVQAQWSRVGIDLEIVPTTDLVGEWYLAAGANGDLNPVPLLRGLPDSFPRMFQTTAFANICDTTFPGIDECSSELVALTPGSDEYFERSKDCQAILIRDAVVGVMTVFVIQSIGINSEKLANVAYQIDPILQNQLDVTEVYVRVT